jgi:hypothetical protein
MDMKNNIKKVRYSIQWKFIEKSWMEWVRVGCGPEMDLVACKNVRTEYRRWQNIGRFGFLRLRNPVSSSRQHSNFRWSHQGVLKLDQGCHVSMCWQQQWGVRHMEKKGVSSSRSWKTGRWELAEPILLWGTGSTLLAKDLV